MFKSRIAIELYLNYTFIRNPNNEPISFTNDSEAHIISWILLLDRRSNLYIHEPEAYRNEFN